MSCDFIIFTKACPVLFIHKAHHLYFWRWLIMSDNLNPCTLLRDLIVMLDCDQIYKLIERGVSMCSLSSPPAPFASLHPSHCTPFLFLLWPSPPSLFPLSASSFPLLLPLCIAPLLSHSYLPSQSLCVCLSFSVHKDIHSLLIHYCYSHSYWLLD